jgi:hypothetical protein
MSLTDRQRLGGFASLAMAGTFVVGFVVFLGVLAPAGYFDQGVDAAEKARIIVENQTAVSISYLVPFVLFSILLVVLSLALYERLKPGSPAIAQTAAVFGIIWAGLVIASGMVAVVGIRAVAEISATDPEQAGPLWVTIEAVQLGLGGGIEIVGALWVLLTGWAALRSQVFPRALNYLAIAIGISGGLTIVPALEMFAAFFGLGLIVWFIWIGVVMQRVSRVSMPATGRVQTCAHPG